MARKTELKIVKLGFKASPCAKWSIAQKNNRETIPAGEGWELFLNCVIAQQKFNPDFFIYENNKSIAKPIKEAIHKELGGTQTEINSNLVSAQNRARFYQHSGGVIPLPEDRGILLKDVLDTGVIDKEKAYCLKHQAGNARDYFKKHHTQIAFEPIIFNTPHGYNDGGMKYGKAPTLTANGAWQCNNHVIEPITTRGVRDKFGCLLASYHKTGVRDLERNLIDGLGKQGIIESASDMARPVYEVKNGLITIKEKTYPIKLSDGLYIIRKLSVAECCRLQTLPDDYCRAVSDTQAYKGLGNGWTAEVIIHILSYLLKDVPLDTHLDVLSMYDGIGTGRYCLDKMGYKNITYKAYEIDKYAIKVAMSNYPDIIQCGDAFDIRRNDWNWGHI